MEGCPRSTSVTWLTSIVSLRYTLRLRGALSLTKTRLTVSIEVNTLVANVISTLEPVLKTVTDTVGGAKELGEDAVAATLKTAFTTIDSALSELSGSLGGLAGGALKTKRAGHAKRALSDQEVATTLANLLNGVAGRCKKLPLGLTAED